MVTKAQSLIHNDPRIAKRFRITHEVKLLTLLFGFGCIVYRSHTHGTADFCNIPNTKSWV